jgi:trimeric autotransporter adhesin
MNHRRRMVTTLLGIAASLSFAAATQASGTLIRWHKMGEEEGGTNNSPVSTTLDSPVDGSDFVALDLSASNGPVYRTISGRPDGGTGVGIEFSAASQQFLAGYALNWPEQSPLDANSGGQYDLTGIDDRGFQLWVRPISAAAQTIVMDTNQHGVRIDSTGKFSMRYANIDYASSVTAAPNTWYHIEVVRPSGAANGARMYINGNAVVVAGQNGDYAADVDTFMTVGSNTTFDGEFYSGITDDLRMYVFGTNTSAFDYGTFNLATDNAYVSSTVTGLKGVAGDVTNDGFLTQADKDAFIAGWLHKRLVNGVQIGDLTSHGQGDLNLDGITNILDLALMQQALSGSGLGTISAADLSAVPEPAAFTLLTLAVMAWQCRRRRGVR